MYSLGHFKIRTTVNIMRREGKMTTSFSPFPLSYSPSPLPPFPSPPFSSFTPQLLGATHPDVAKQFCNLAVLCQHLGKYDEVIMTSCYLYMYTMYYVTAFPSRHGTCRCDEMTLGAHEPYIYMYIYIHTPCMSQLCTITCMCHVCTMYIHACTCMCMYCSLQECFLEKY